MPMSDDFHREVFGEQPRRTRGGWPSARPRHESGVDFERMRRDAQRAAQKTAKQEVKRAARNAARAADSWSSELLGLDRAKGGLFDGWGWLGKSVQSHVTSRKGGDRSLEDRVADELRDFFDGSGWKW